MQISSRRSFHLFVMSAFLGAALAAVPMGIDRGKLFGADQAFAAGRPDGGGGNSGQGSHSGGGQDSGHDGNGCSRNCN
jgi:hypothetical protein